MQPNTLEGKSTAGSRVYQRLRHDVISGELQPGQRLTLETLKNQYQVGMTPLREALYRLSASLLVITEDHQGFRVADISLEHLQQVLTAREHFECLILKESIARGDLAWEGRVISAHHALTRFPPYHPDGSVSTDYLVAHRRFHYEILSGSQHFFLEHFQTVIWDHYARYRNLLSVERIDMATLASEHAQILDRVLAKDFEMAALVLGRHISHGAQELCRAMQNKAFKAPSRALRGAAIASAETGHSSSPLPVAGAGERA